MLASEILKGPFFLELLSYNLISCCPYQQLLYYPKWYEKGGPYRSENGLVTDQIAPVSG